MLTTLAIANYRSIRDLVLPLTRLNVVTGANGSGKSSLYRALRLLAETAQGGLIASIAREGGLQSTLWAGPESFSRSVKAGEYPVEGTRRKGPIQLRMGFATDQFGYAIDLGLPRPEDSTGDERPEHHSQFLLDPVIKRECVWAGPVFRDAALMVDRHGASLRATNANGDWRLIPQRLSGYESMMSEFADPTNAPEMLVVRQEMRSWRFYDHFRTDFGAPARQPQIGTHTPILGHDGADVAAALQTIREIGDIRALDEAIDDAFPGSSIEVINQDGRFEIEMRQHGLLRPLRNAELSDGTLRYLLLVAVLLTPRPPSLMVLNEPETSLHPDLIPALARRIANASAMTQVIIVTHSRALLEHLIEDGDTRVFELEKQFGETLVADRDACGSVRWHWPKR
ncbi:MAG TPA: AAA family ATPase [Stellaceae bacterium]|nr:AAA family ATPase [Stellaceae bacterium]